MQLQNFECQIAKAQIGRYVAGDVLSDEAVEQLEAHIAKCEGCKQNLAERRAVLQAMLAPAEPEPYDEPQRTRFDLAEFIKSKVRTRQPVQAAVQIAESKPSTFTKPAMYSLALGGVLIGMSYLSKNMGSVLGPNAASPIQQVSNTVPKLDSSTSNKAASWPVSKPEALTTIVPAKKPVAAKAIPNPKPAHPKPVGLAKKQLAEPTHKISHKAPRHSSNRIRVYAPEN